MDISIIIPTYRPGTYLYKCLDSIRCQQENSFNFEVLIILNGPLDDYISKIENYLAQHSCQNFKLLTTTAVGVSSARNKGLDIAVGDFIFFMDDDDILSENYFRQLLNSASSKRLSCSIIRNFKEDIQSSEKNYTGQLFTSDSTMVYHDKFRYRRLFSTCTAKLIPSRSIASRRFNENFKLGEDALFMAHISNAIEELILCSEVCYYRRIRKNSATMQKNSVIYELKNARDLLFAYSKIYLSSPIEYSFTFLVFRGLAVLKGLKFRLTHLVQLVISISNELTIQSMETNQKTIEF
ncbi:glycosyltransferase family 2 protein [Maribacter algicola]|uniref:Glycosyltransferase family 2 protein n=1 Tax=Meishania litoralis TaxID=3434685 RepID=A0ACC7LPI4_9FLAO